jgi:hypothetical protein
LSDGVVSCANDAALALGIQLQQPLQPQMDNLSRRHT